MDDHAIRLFGGALETASRALDLRARNHDVIINNVANADTPNFQPFEMHVEETLQAGTPAADTPQLQQTDQRHLPGRHAPEGPSSHSDAPKSATLLLRGDGNGVDLDAEMTALARNTLLYRASAQIVSSKFGGLKNVITGGNK